MKRRLRRERSEISEHRGKEGDRKKESSVLDEQGRTRNEEKENASGCEGERKKKGRGGKEGEKEMQRLPYNGAPRAHKLRHNVISSSLFNER